MPLTLEAHCRKGAIDSKGSFTHHRWMHTMDFWEALAFMIAKGLEQHMLPLVSAHDQDNPDGKSAPSCPNLAIALSIAISSRKCKCQFYSIVRGCARKPPPTLLPNSDVSAHDHEITFQLQLNVTHKHNIRYVISSLLLQLY